MLVNLAANAGLTTLSGNTNLDLSVTLGGGEIRLLDLVQAYSIFPNGGYHIDPVFILKVTDRGGRVLYQWENSPLTQRVIDERVAFLITKHPERRRRAHSGVWAQQRAQYRASSRS